MEGRGAELGLLAVLKYLDVFLKLCHSYGFNHNLSILKYGNIILNHGDNHCNLS